jgi:hypothetical protein
MSIIGILSSNLFAAGAAHNTQGSQNKPTDFQQIKTEFQQLGQDLKAGNLQLAQQDFTSLQQDVQQISSQQVEGRHHHHQPAGGLPPSSTPSFQPANPIAQAFSTLAQDLQAGNLSGAQLAYATLQNDIRQIGGFLPGGSSGTSGVSGQASSGSLNVTA